MIRVSKMSKNGLRFLGNEEGLRLKAYLDSVGVATIGYGNTFYENGAKVKMGDTITAERAESLFRIIVSKFEDAVAKATRDDLNQNQFDALVSLAYNIGIAGFQKSTVLKRVNANPLDKSIGLAIQMWCNAGGKPILLNRRKRETTLYFTPCIHP